MLVVLCNCPPDAAPAIARALVEERRAACVNLIPGVRSVYTWQGEVCDDQETTLLIKVPAERYDALAARLIELHPYEVPEVIALSPEAVHEPYARWAREVVGDDEA